MRRIGLVRRPDAAPPPSVLRFMHYSRVAARGNRGMIGVIEPTADYCRVCGPGMMMG